MFSFYLFISDAFTFLGKVFTGLAACSLRMGRRFHNKARATPTAQNYLGR